MKTKILTGYISPQNKEKSEKVKDVVKERLRLTDWQISQRIDEEESRKEAAEKKATQDKNKLSFSDFCKSLEYRRTAVYYRGKHLFDKFNPKINRQNERIFFDYLTENNLILTY